MIYLHLASWNCPYIFLHTYFWFKMTHSATQLINALVDLAIHCERARVNRLAFNTSTPKKEWMKIENTISSVDIILTNFYLKSLLLLVKSNATIIIAIFLDVIFSQNLVVVQIIWLWSRFNFLERLKLLCTHVSSDSKFDVKFATLANGLSQFNIIQ